MVPMILPRGSKWAAGLLIAFGFTFASTPADGGDHSHKKHRKMTFDLVQGYALPTSVVQPIFLVGTAPNPADGNSDESSGSSLASAQHAQKAPAKSSIASLPKTPIPLFDPTAFAPSSALASVPATNTFAGFPSMVASNPFAGLAATTFVPAQVQTYQMAAAPVQLASMPVQMASFPMQLASVPLVQTTTTMASVQPTFMSVAAQQPQGLTPVQVLVPRQKHCCFPFACHH